MTKRIGRAALAARALDWVLFDHDCGADSDMATALGDCGEPMVSRNSFSPGNHGAQRDPTSSVKDVAERLPRDYAGQATRCYRYSITPLLQAHRSCLRRICFARSEIACTPRTTNQNNEVDVVRSRIQSLFNPRPSSTRIASSRYANFLRYRSFPALSQNRSS
jgi:hypothetical protein